MNRTLKVVVLPMNIAWGDRDENLYTAANLLGDVPKDTDVVVLPELFSTGYVSDQVLIANLTDTEEYSPSIDMMRRCAAQYNFAICGSIMYRRPDGCLVNRAIFVEPSGEMTVYDKRHLFMLSTERHIFTPGTQAMPVVRFRGFNIAMCVCFDLRFPAWLRNDRYQYDVLLIPANWPQSRGYAWRTLLAARAMENQAYVVGADRSGIDDYGDYEGMAQINDYLGIPTGDTISVHNLSSIAATISLDAIHDARRGFPVIEDADHFKFITE